MQKPDKILMFKTFIAKKKIDFLNFHQFFAKIAIFRPGSTLWCHNFATAWPIFMILVSMDRGDPHLYYGSKQQYFMCVNFKITGGGNQPPSVVVLPKMV